MSGREPGIQPGTASLSFGSGTTDNAKSLGSPNRRRLVAVVDRMQINPQLILAVVLNRPHGDRAAVESSRCCGEARGGEEPEHFRVADAAIAIDLAWRSGDLLAKAVDADADLRVGGDADDSHVHAFSVAADEGGDESDDGGDQGGAAMGGD